MERAFSTGPARPALPSRLSHGQSLRETDDDVLAVAPRTFSSYTLRRDASFGQSSSQHLHSQASLPRGERAPQGSVTPEAEGFLSLGASRGWGRGRLDLLRKLLGTDPQGGTSPSGVSPSGPSMTRPSPTGRSFTAPIALPPPVTTTGFAPAATQSGGSFNSPVAHSTSQAAAPAPVRTAGRPPRAGSAGDLRHGPGPRPRAVSPAPAVQAVLPVADNSQNADISTGALEQDATTQQGWPTPTAHR